MKTKGSLMTKFLIALLVVAAVLVGVTFYSSESLKKMVGTDAITDKTIVIHNGSEYAVNAEDAEVLANYLLGKLSVVKFNLSGETAEFSCDKEAMDGYLVIFDSSDESQYLYLDEKNSENCFVSYGGTCVKATSSNMKKILNVLKSWIEKE